MQDKTIHFAAKPHEVHTLVSLKKTFQTWGNPPILSPRPVKTAEDPWKPLLCQSCCPVKNSCREPLYGDSYVEKNILGPVKVLEDQQNLDFLCGYRSSGPVKAQKFSWCLIFHDIEDIIIYSLIWGWLVDSFIINNVTSHLPVWGS